MSSILTAQMEQEAAKRRCLGWAGKGPFPQDRTPPLVHRLSPCRDVTLYFPFILPPSPTPCFFHSYGSDIHPWNLHQVKQKPPKDGKGASLDSQVVSVQALSSLSTHLMSPLNLYELPW